jgi:hypothetical protein
VVAGNVKTDALGNDKAAEEEIYTGWKEEIPKSRLNIQGRPFNDRVCKF